MSATRNKFSPEFRDRAVRMVDEHRGDYPSEWAAMTSIAIIRDYQDIFRSDVLVINYGKFTSFLTYLSKHVVDVESIRPRSAFRKMKILCCSNH